MFTGSLKKAVAVSKNNQDISNVIRIKNSKKRTNLNLYSTKSAPVSLNNSKVSNFSSKLDNKATNKRLNNASNPNKKVEFA